MSGKEPIVALIGGRTAPGREAAFRHTGSRAMTDEEADAFCADSGMVRVKSLRALMLAGKAFGAASGRHRPARAAAVQLGRAGCAGDRSLRGIGPGAAGASCALAERLRALYPPEAVVANPLDLLADAREDRFGDTLEAVLQLARDSFDAILMIHVVPFMVDADPVVARLAALAKVRRCRSCMR